jgi:hypothetical protein
MKNPKSILRHLSQPTNQPTMRERKGIKTVNEGLQIHVHHNALHEKAITPDQKE